MTAPPTRLRIAVEPYESDNPFIGLFTNALRDTGAEVEALRYPLRYLSMQDVIIIHFPTLFMGGDDFRSAWRIFWRLFVARKIFGVKLVWVAHNLTSHDRQQTPMRAAMFLNQLDGIIHLSHFSHSIVRRRYRIPRRVRELVTVHGSYPGETAAMPLPPRQGPIRLLSFGLVRAYKGWDELLEAFTKVENAATLRLVGKAVDVEYAERLSAASRKLDRVSVDFRTELLTTAELEQEIDYADGIVLPYREILNSGSAIHTLSRHRPVMVPSIGSMPELAQNFEQGWVHLYDGPLASSGLQEFISGIVALRGTSPDLSNYDWLRISAVLGNWLGNL